MTYERLAYRLQEAAAALGVPDKVIVRALDKGEIQSFRVGRFRLIPADALRGYMAHKIEEHPRERPRPTHLEDSTQLRLDLN